MRTALTALLDPSGMGTSAITAIDDWDALIAEATSHGVVPLLRNVLGRAQVPSGPADRIRDIYLHSMLRAETIQQDAGSIVRALGDAGIATIALKGLHLAFGVYEEPAVRPMVDIDLLVHETDVKAASELLGSLGYAVSVLLGEEMDYTDHHHLRPVLKRGAIQVELHRAFEPRSAPFRTDLDAVWQRSVTMNLYGVEVRVMALDDLLLHVCTHAAYNHRFEVRLLSLFDVVTLVGHPELDWDRLVKTANGDGRARFVFATMQAAEHVWPNSTAPQRLDDLKHNEADRRAAEIAATQVTQAPMDVPVGLRAARSTEGTGPKVRSLLGSAFPPPDRMRKMYDLPPNSNRVWWKYLVRPFDLVRRRGRDAAALVVRTERGRSVLDREDRSRLLSTWASLEE